MLVKFCGMRNAELLELAASLGVDLCGFIFHPRSPRYIDPGELARLPTFGMARTGVFVGHTEDEIREIAKIARLDLIQLHGNQDEKCAINLGRDRIIRVIWPERFNRIAELNEYLEKMAPSSSYFLLDAGRSLGGSGKTLDAGFLKDLASPLPWLLAGGLSPENIGSCLRQLRPDGVDINSGLESSPGHKDMEKMRTFFLNLNKSPENGEEA